MKSPIARLGAVLLLAALLLMTGMVALSAAAPPDARDTPPAAPARAAAFHTVCPSGECDFRNIQDAIDAAAAGDEIRVTAEDYEEHLVITKALTLSGGWDAGFKFQDAQTVLDNPDAAKPVGHGRMITATAEEITGTITIDHFTVMNGNASVTPVTETVRYAQGDRLYFSGPLAGKAGVPAGERPGILAALEAGSATASAATGTAQEREAAQIARLEGLLPVRGPADLAIPGAPAVLKPTKGGGLYVTNASLRLLHANFYFNVANDLGAGVGGAVAAEDVGTVEVRDCIFKWNTGSSIYTGAGGGLYISYALEDGVEVAGNTFASNQAGFGSDPTTKDSLSYGGGLAASMARGIRVHDNVFQGNLSSYYGTLGAGGGMQLISTRRAVVTGNLFEANTSLARNRPQQTNDYGTGGGAEINLSTGATVQHNIFRSNVSAVFMSGWGGGLSMNTSNDVLVSDNEFTENWAAFRTPEQLIAYHNAGGGGLSMITDLNARVLNNTFSRNRAAYWQTPSYDASGGGMFAETGIENMLVAGNTFSDNQATDSGAGRGGGFAAMYSDGDSVTLRGNQFLRNRASLSGPGEGGAIFSSITLTLESNLIQGNIASGRGDGAGGGAAFGRVRSTRAPERVTLTANRFLDNQAQPDGAGTGGAVYLRASGGFSVTNNIVAHNAAEVGGGLALSGEMADRDGPRLVANNTVVENGGDGIWHAGWPVTQTLLLNNIIAGHSTGITAGKAVSDVVSGPLLIDYTLFDKNVADVGGDGPSTVAHSLHGDPLFVDPPAHNYRLLAKSPARDAGHTGDPAPAADADGKARPYGPRTDVGAYEYRPWFNYLPGIAK